MDGRAAILRVKQDGGFFISRQRRKMGYFFEVLKKDKSARFIFIIFAALILLGVACVIFAMTYPSCNKLL